MKTNVKSVLVAGTGTMGGGIAQVAAAAGDAVLLYDRMDGVARRAKERIGESLARAAAKGYFEAGAIGPTLERLRPINSLEEAAGVDAVIEAVQEDLEAKRVVFLALERIMSSDTLFWTNTSMTSITQIADPLRHPERVAGTHFFNPAPRMKLVEIVAGAKTSVETVRIAEETVKRWGKTPVRAPDSPGFIVNRILDAIKRESLALLDEGVPAEQIDLGVRLGLNFPMGPFELMDLIGLDTTLFCLVTQARATGRSPRFSATLEQLVADGHCGRKTGKGFYAYKK